MPVVFAFTMEDSEEIFYILRILVSKQLNQVQDHILISYYFLYCCVVYYQFSWRARIISYFHFVLHFKLLC